MGKIFFAVFAFVLSFAFSVIGQSRSSTLIASQDLVGFEKCTIGKKLSSLVDELHKSGSPILKDEETLVFSVESQFLGLPVKALEIGICEDGSRDCGWGSFLGLEIPMPLNEAKTILKQKTRIDYTIPRRASADSGRYTLRPLLSTKAGKKNESILFCDPGDL